MEPIFNFICKEVPQYIIEHRIEIIGSLLLLLFDSLRKEINREQTAKRSYFYRLGDYFLNTDNMIPSPEELKMMKERFAQQFNVGVECFPAKQNAIDEFFLFLETTTKLSWTTKSVIHEKFSLLCSKFEENDYAVESQPIHQINKHSIRNVFSIFLGIYSLIMIIETVPSLFTLESFNNPFINVIGSLAAIGIVSGFATFCYFLFVIGYKYMKKIYWKILRK